MTFEIQSTRPSIRRNSRKDEVLKMLCMLAEAPDNLTAHIDMASSTVRSYAKQLGFKVRVRRIDNRHSYVWIDTTKDQKGMSDE